MNIKNVLIAVGVVVLGFIGSQFSNSNVSNKIAGALSGPDIISSYLNVGGVRHEFRSEVTAVATSTVCSFQAPSATSTLVFASLRTSLSTSTAMIFTLATSTSPSATTSPINSFSQAASIQSTMVHIATSSTAGDGGKSLIAPNVYVNWGVNGLLLNSTPSSDFGGYCEAEFIVH